jgi:hypothetical protein
MLLLKNLIKNYAVWCHADDICIPNKVECLGKEECYKKELSLYYYPSCRLRLVVQIDYDNLLIE